MCASALLALCACPKRDLPRLPDGGVDRGPVIDSHTLITPVDESIDITLELFKRVGVVKFCNKNGGYLGSRLFAATIHQKHRLKERFEFFVNPNWRGVDEPGWGQREADSLEQAVRWGARGIKFFKAMGLGARDREGKLIAVDDPRYDPIMERAAKINAIVAMHIGDPKAFFEPPTPQNERYDELKQAPDWSFYGGDYPPLLELLAARNRLIARHPKTTFLLIHVGNYPEDLDHVSRTLERFPNVYTDTAARVPEIGRKPPAEVRRFFLRWQDRIMFGTDLAIGPDHVQLGSVSEKPPTFDDAVEFYRRHYRYFETDDKDFDHPTPIQGRWKISGIKLPPEVLRKFYYDNAEKLIFKRAMGVPVVDPLEQPLPAPEPASAPAPGSSPAQ
ncbi:MAG: amidohydrolase family protein [Deltaproteobacteria bacterium]|nr:amidohydrolase family protein [Deltaproteobacteria bacterium]